MKTLTSFIIAFCCTILTILSSAQQINWPAFMQAQNLKWDRLGKNYYEGVILGNGLLGINIYEQAQNIIRFDIGRSDVVDNRTAVAPQVNKLYTQARLPIGHFELGTKSAITSSEIVLDIYNAIAKGKIKTEKGEIDFTAYVSAVGEVMVIELHKTGAEEASGLKFVPEESKSARLGFNRPDKPESYPANPPILASTQGSFRIYHQQLLNRGGYASVYTSNRSKGFEKVNISIGYDEFNNLDEIAQAKNYVKAFEKNSASTNLLKHANWWHNYYQKSFVSLPDKRMESFYWAQLYKLACLTRPNKPMIDLMGPWTSDTPWPAIWWNLNVQLSYSPMAVINHTELSEPLLNTLAKNEQQLRKNVPEQWQGDASLIGRSSSYTLESKISMDEIASGNFEAANLCWTMFYCYEYYLHTKDEQRLRKEIYPLLKRSTNFMIHLLKKDESGKYHFPVSISPEYSQNGADANYVLSTLRWALKTLSDVNTQLKLNDSDTDKWKDLAANLSEYPKDATGFMIARGLPLSTSHRHYSHLLMIYPYHLINWENPADRPVISQSLNHWISLKGALQGYTYTGAASIYASMGKGDSSARMLDQLFTKYIKPNTLYRESGPVIETPLAALNSVCELLIQSWGAKVRVFPAVPSNWKNASFDKLGAEGAFEVSARYENRHTTYIQVKSLKGGICRIQTTMKPEEVMSDSTEKTGVTIGVFEDQQLISFDTKAGEIITLKAKKQTTGEINPVPYQFNTAWHWGLNQGR
ncbi:glycosyl hydrolase family 95 catalytic domain-containing protein [Pedobacter aquatilis]|uniref:glycosyl hydrolase family 95 catalytic domain-containing protein n=1 Tax=Pedobacter aquatilis TaxID=351343 RepID=UPI00292CB78C|nr:hypothetical protein [Pedobacter aquatilis]